MVSGATLVGRVAAAACAAALTGCAASAAQIGVGGATADRSPSQPGACHASGAGRFSLPDRRCTPGAVSRAVTQANIAATVCRRGYTKRVRPPESVTEPQKLAAMAAYGDRGSARRYEYDHLIPLELGGAPDDPHNLWPEPGASPNRKDRLEGVLRSLVCRRRLSLAVAQSAIARDWVAAYHRLVR